MTSPINIKSKVTVKSQLSTATRFAMERISFHHGDGSARRLFAGDLRKDLTLLVRLYGQTIYHLLEQLAAMFVVAELVEAGTGGSEQDDIPGCGNFGGMSDRGFQGFGVIEFRAAILRRNNL